MSVLIRPEKRCFKCAEKLPLSEFYRHPMMADGHLGKCKSCARDDVVTNRQQRLEQYRTYDRARQQTAARQQLRDQLTAVERRDHPERARARNRLRRAVRMGLIAKPSICTACGQPHEYIHGHHPDYSQPLDVVWLCPSCHVYVNRAEVEARRWANE